MTLRIALAQLNLLVGDIAGNADSVIEAALRARDRQVAHAIVFPELTLTGYPPEDLLLRPELAPDQKDQDSLPAYEILDAVLERYVEQDQSVNDIIAAGFEEPVVVRIARLVDINEYKRRQAPPGVRITRRAFGRGRRYPLTSGF